MSAFDPRSPEEAQKRLYLDLAYNASGEFYDCEVDDNFEDVGEELIANWDSYTNEFYHGTQLENFSDILRDGAIRPGEQNNADSGEVSNQSAVYFTRLEPVAVHYAEEAQPIREDIFQAVVNDLEEELSDEEWADLELNYRMIHDVIPAALHSDELDDDIKQRYEALQDRLFDIPEDERDPMVVGFSKQNADVYEVPPQVDHEFEAAEINEHLAQGIAKSVEIDNKASFYVSHEEVGPMRDQYENLESDILSLDALKLRHRLKMDPVYEKEGVVDMVPFWKGQERGIEWNMKSKEPGLNFEISS